MLARRYADDGKEFYRLNPTQIKAKQSYLKKVREGRYCYTAFRCDCGAEIADMDLIAEKDRYGLPVITRICKKCGLLMTNPTLDQESLNQFYDSEYRSLYVGAEIPQEDYFFRQYKHGERIYKFLKDNIGFESIGQVLEIGTGAGGILKAISDKEDVSVTGIDLGNEYIKFGQMHGLNLYHMDSEKLVKESAHSYDLIILSHVLEHFLDLKKELKVVKELLSDRGFLYVEVPGIKNIPNIYGDFMGFLQNAHIRHFTLDTLTQTLGWNGFSLIVGNEQIQSIYKKAEINIPHKSYYEENLKFLQKMEKDNFF